MVSIRRRELLWLLSILMFVQIRSLLGADCKQEEIKYEFTECDSSDKRWRVAVPKTPGSCEVKENPTRQEKCTFSCEPGNYLDINSAKLECKKCPVGHYSVGGGVRFTNWDKLPAGFESHSSEMQYRNYGYDNEFSKSKGANCSETGWLALGDSIATTGDGCTAQLSYAVTLKRDGHVKFKYHFTDRIYTIFKVFLRNDQCRSSVSTSDIYPRNTLDNQWLEKKIELKAGRNLITWEVSAITGYGSSHEKRDPVYISEIEVQGVAYTSECQMCEPGTFAEKEGSGFCEVCPKNTFSSIGSSKCSKCNEVTEFSVSGSANCTERKPCTQQDYYDSRSACDNDHKTQIKYQWIEPKICRDDVKGAVKLPASGAKEDCPPCNPGMRMNGTECIFCPANHYSDGKQDCKACAVSTSAVYGFDLKWWRNIPPHMRASCFSISDRGCTNRQGWQPQGNFISSGINHGDDVYLVLTLTTKGFGAPQSKRGTFGEISFTFELVCQGDCVFRFKQNQLYKGQTQIETWKGEHTKTKYRYFITSQSKVTFKWTFQKVPSEFDLDGMTQNYPNDRVIIHSINVTNTIDGGAAKCKSCPVTSNSNSGCVACPSGYYIDEKQKKCVACPKNTYLDVANPYGLKACKPCGPGLISDEASTSCHSNCKFMSKKHSREFDFSELQGQTTVRAAPSFTTRGSRYFHVFRLNLCGHPYKEAICHSNISVNTAEKENFNLSSSVCRFTLIPNRQGEPLAAQPIRLGEELGGIYEDSVHVNETSAFEDEGLITNISTYFSYHYHSHRPTGACKNGRTVFVTLLCDHTAPEKGVIQLPAKCPDGTCDGCKFQFLWRTKYACPKCSVADYKKVMGACVQGGTKTTSYMWKQPRICRDGVTLPEEFKEKCSILDQTVASAMKDFKIGIGIAALLAVLLVCSVCFLYFKNRKLTYKYHRLVGNGTGHPDELPAVEKCGMDDDEEDEDEEIHFRRGAKDRGKKLLKSLRGLTKSKKDKVTFDDEDDGGDEEFFESVQLEAVKEPLKERF